MGEWAQGEPSVEPGEPQTSLHLKPKPLCAVIADRFPTAGIFYISDYVLNPAPAPHWSYENCDAGFPPASLPVRTLPYAPPACRFLRRRRSLRIRSTPSPKLEESDEHRRQLCFRSRQAE